MTLSPGYPRLVPDYISSRSLQPYAHTQHSTSSPCGYLAIRHWAVVDCQPQESVGHSAVGLAEALPNRFSNVRDGKLARLEAVLLVSDGALTFRRLAQLAILADAAEARALADRLNESYDRVGCAFRVERVATGCRLMTRPQFARWIDRLHNRQALVKLSPAMMETLSIVAYRQQVTRAEIEKIRGVQSAEMLKQLMERGYVRITGEDNSLGRPFLYGTTRQFLEAFGLRDLDAMPMSDSLRRVAALPPEDESLSDEDPGAVPNSEPELGTSSDAA